MSHSVTKLNCHFLKTNDNAFLLSFSQVTHCQSLVHPFAASTSQKSTHWGNTFNKRLRNRVCKDVQCRRCKLVAMSFPLLPVHTRIWDTDLAVFCFGHVLVQLDICWFISSSVMWWCRLHLLTGHFCCKNLKRCRDGGNIFTAWSFHKPDTCSWSGFVSKADGTCYWLKCYVKFEVTNVDPQTDYCLHQRCFITNTRSS